MLRVSVARFTFRVGFRVGFLGYQCGLCRLLLLGNLLPYSGTVHLGSHRVSYNVPNDCNADTVAITITNFFLSDKYSHKFFADQATKHVANVNANHRSVCQPDGVPVNPVYSV